MVLSGSRVYHYYFIAPQSRWTRPFRERPADVVAKSCDEHEKTPGGFVFDLSAQRPKNAGFRGEVKLYA